MKRIAWVCMALVASAGIAAAQPAQQNEKVDAKALMASGVKLLGAKDYLGALAVFKDAYQRFPSAKILLNIGTTLRLLNRNADAANAYQRYLDATDADTAKKPEVERVLAQLDATVGMLEITSEPTGIEVQVGDEEWRPVLDVKRWRVAPGNTTVRGRRVGYDPIEKPVSVAAGASAAVPLVLTTTPRTPVPVANNGAASGGNELHQTAPVEAPPMKIGAFAAAHVDVIHKGGAGLVGALYDITPRIEVQAAALIGPSSGAYVGGRFAILTGALKPIVSAGMPVFFSSGPRFSIRGAGGVEYAINRHFSIIAEVGVEHVFNPEAGIKSTLFVPALGASGRL
jgi:hypothetical protein